MTAPNIHEVANLLEFKYKDFDHHNKLNPLNELLFIICSTKTSEHGYSETYRCLMRKFPRLRMLIHAKEYEIEQVIRRGGLAKKKAAAIKGIIRNLTLRFGKPTLSRLRVLSDVECERLLVSLPGVGKKVARCVMLYSLHRDVFPVDEHCWRVCRRLGWIKQTRRNRSGSPRDEDRLQEKIPPGLRFSLHVNMLSLGREICTPTKPKCESCPIQSVCRKIGVLNRNRSSPLIGEHYD